MATPRTIGTWRCRSEQTRRYPRPVPITALLAAAILFWLIVGCAAPALTPQTQSANDTPASLQTSQLPASPEPTCPPKPASPPSAAIEDARGDVVAGFLSANSYCEGILPTPAWDPAPIQLSADDVNVLVFVDDGPPFVAWHAEAQATSTAIAPSASGPRIVLADGADTAGVASVSFAGPLPGDWMLTATLTFPGQLGSASYSWMVRAP
jgi:hypothetical protein